jgi:hypothetical protein
MLLTFPPFFECNPGQRLSPFDEYVCWSACKNWIDIYKAVSRPHVNFYGQTSLLAPNVAISVDSCCTVLKIRQN